ncbi:hypothetical protein D3C86_1248450 [compost metagenome]
MAITTFKKPLINSVFARLYRPNRLAMMAINSRKTIKAMDQMIHFSLSFSRRPFINVTSPTTTPTMDTISINQRSILEACSTRLATAVIIKNKTIISHTRIQYLFTYLLKIMVRQTQETNQKITFKIKGGDRKKNWNRLSTINKADNKGYRSTSWPSKSGFSKLPSI